MNLTMTEPTSTAPIDPLRRVFVPIEHARSDGTALFMTTDRMPYVRLADGSIRRGVPKRHGKAARRADKAQRQVNRSGR